MASNVTSFNVAPVSRPAGREVFNLASNPATRPSRNRRHRPALRGFTLVEFLFAAGISALVIGQVCMLWLFSSRSFAAQMSYVDMDQAGQRALDELTREIRQVRVMTSYSPNRVVFVDVNNQNLTFEFVNGQLVRTKGVTAKVLLKNCEFGSFAIYQRNPKEGAYEYYPAASPATCKLIEVRWVCRRSPLPMGPGTRAGMQSAKILLRST